MFIDESLVHPQKHFSLISLMSAPWKITVVSIVQSLKASVDIVEIEIGILIVTKGSALKHACGIFVIEFPENTTDVSLLHPVNALLPILETEL